MINRSAITDIVVTALCLLVVTAIIIQLRESKSSANHELLKAIRAKLESSARSLEDVRERLRALEEGDKKSPPR